MIATQQNQAVRNALAALQAQRETASPVLLETLDRIADAIVRTGDHEGVGRQLAAEVLIIRWRRTCTDDGTDTLRAFHDEVEDAIRTADDPKAAFQRILDLIQGEHSRTRGATL